MARDGAEKRKRIGSATDRKGVNHLEKIDFIIFFTL
jgi:hypothetical protein